jgi:hypothetical protein
MKRFCDIQPKDFPLSNDAYNALMDQIRNVARGFADIGSPDGDAVDKSLMEVWEGLSKTWNLIQRIEDREQMDEGDF